MRNYGFWKLTAKEMPLLERWLSLAHVRIWWPDTARQLAMIENHLTNPLIDMHLVTLNQHPFAYIHDHDRCALALPQYGDLPPRTRVMATFIGDTGFLGQDHAAAYIMARLRDWRIKYPVIAASPDMTDTQTISSFTKAGFRKRRLAPIKDGKLVQVLTYQ